MPHSHHSSSGSVSCRLEWRPSLWLIGALLLLGTLATFSILASDLPRAPAWMLSIAVMVHAANLALRQWRSPVRSLVFPGTELPVLVDGMPVEAVDVQWRGPLAFVSWNGRVGRRVRLCWWPDTLPASLRRELRLAAGSLQASRHALAMAP
ncbi:MAG: hypothetical protein ABWY01_08520 [Pseudoxanthomonas sp.]